MSAYFYEKYFKIIHKNLYLYQTTKYSSYIYSYIYILTVEGRNKTVGLKYRPLSLKNRTKMRTICLFIL